MARCSLQSDCLGLGTHAFTPPLASSVCQADMDLEEEERKIKRKRNRVVLSPKGELSGRS